MRVGLSLNFILALALIAGFSGSVQADPKPWYFGWGPAHWQDQNFKPYLENPTQPQNSQWDDKNWVPANWNVQREGGAPELIRGFYTAGIISRQYVDNRVPVLEVGPSFYDLSGYDKRRILRVVDEQYKITSSHKNAMFTLTDWRTKKPIGLYTANGLQLQ